MKETDKELGHLLKKYAAARCSKQEFNRLLDIIECDRQNDHLSHLLKKQWEAIDDRPPHSVRFRWMVTTATVAASILLFVGLTFLYRESESVVSTSFASHEQEVSEAPEGVTQVKLPDGSKVMLRDGSRLDLTSSFEGNTREIALEGEAYFDVVPDSLKPFIIHTGKVKTTVLGTAFSIKAHPYEKRVLVTVVRGKVKVEDDKKVLAILEADDQLVYNIKSNEGVTKTVEAVKEVDWKSHDMIFRDTPFGHITQELAEIYEVNIAFDSNALPQRLITASLDDRDSIERLLDILCTSQRAYCVLEEGVYVIRPLKNIQISSMPMD